MYSSKKLLINVYNKEMNKSLAEDSDKSRKDLIDGILQNSLWDIEEEDDDFEGIDGVYNLMLSEVSCACNPCLSGDIDECTSPFKKWGNTRLVTLKGHEKKDDSE